MSTTARRVVSGWGRTTPRSGTVVTASSADLAAKWPEIRHLTGRGLTPRGLGRAYGDAAINSGGVLVQVADPGVSGIHLDSATGRVRVDAGVSLDALVTHCIGHGWFVPVQPGTRMISIGGAIAAHVHGKNHHRDGAFGAHVRAMDLLCADGEVRHLDPERDHDLWWATVGGMGLTGVILAAEVQMMPVVSSRCRVDTRRIDDLDTMLEVMAAQDADYRYSVAWVDLATRRRGRGVLTRGDHATVDEVIAAEGPRCDPHALPPRRPLPVPARLPQLVRPSVIHAFNTAYFRRAPRHRVGEITSLGAFFTPLDVLADWPHLYGRAGFIQYQFVLPFGAEDALSRAIDLLAASPTGAALGVLKRFGPGDAAMLGFPMPGWTLAADLPAGLAALARTVAQLDDLVLEHGGRIYLAKDAVSQPEVVRAGYGELSRWRDICAQVDPDHIWTSDLDRRLSLR